MPAPCEGLVIANGATTRPFPGADPGVHTLRTGEDAMRCGPRSTGTRKPR